MNELSPLKVLLDTLPQVGQVEWISIRPARDEAAQILDEVEISLEKGLIGDRYGGRPGSPRQVTIIQKEHLDVVGACLHRGSIDPALVRRNIVVSSINLLALKGKTFQIGDAVLEYTGLCHPCNKMERALGTGGYNAMRGHGGITARVIEGGMVRLNDSVFYKAE